VTHQEAVDTLATERYLLNEMSETDRAAFEEHYFSCEDCAQDIKAAHDFRQGAREVFRAEQARRPGPATVVDLASRTRSAWYRSAIVPWAMAASLAGIVVYQSASVRTTVPPEPMAEPMARVLSPITLRPESRGQDPVVTTAAAARGTTFFVDINGARPGTELAYVLVNAAGRQVASDRTAAPADGMPLVVLLSAKAVGDPGRYALTVSDAATGQSLATYTFVRAE
jgi:hypothetical protein